MPPPAIKSICFVEVPPEKQPSKQQEKQWEIERTGDAVTKVKYGESDLSRKIIEERIVRGDKSAKNYAIFEYTDNNGNLAYKVVAVKEK